MSRRKVRGCTSRRSASSGPIQWLRVCSKASRRSRRVDEVSMARLYFLLRTEIVRNGFYSGTTFSSTPTQGAFHVHRSLLAPHVSATPIACALTELAVPHERVKIDIRTGEQRRPEYLAMNPNGKVPTLTVDGAPMFAAPAT